MATKPKPTAAAAPDAPEPQSNTAKRNGSVNVTYRPLDERGDPAATLWNGVKFLANVPVPLHPDRHFVLVPREKHVIGPAGQAIAKPYDEKISMIDLAKTNPSFEVEGFPRAKHIRPPIDPKTGKPKGVPPAGFEWDGTNREEIVGAEAMNWPDDFDPNAGAIEITS